jgi:hypothetical protein
MYIEDTRNTLSQKNNSCLELSVLNTDGRRSFDLAAYMQCQFQQKRTDVVTYLTERFWDHGRYNIGQLSVFILNVNENFQLEVKILYRYASLNDGDAFW